MKYQPKPTTAAKPAEAPRAPEPKKDAPIVTAIALLHIPGQGWTPLRYYIQGDRVIKVDTQTPDVKIIAQEKYKQWCGEQLRKETDS